MIRLEAGASPMILLNKRVPGFGGQMIPRDVRKSHGEANSGALTKIHTMKITIITLITAAGLFATSVAAQAGDKEVRKPHYVHANVDRGQQRRQVALFVSGRGVGDERPASAMQTVSAVGQGGAVTFYTGER
jgi:hypothetical protein